MVYCGEYLPIAFFYGLLKLIFDLHCPLLPRLEQTKKFDLLYPLSKE
jgi:hypothetical protein